MMRFKDDISIQANVAVLLHDASGRLVHEHHGHNLFLDGGRTWLMQALGYDTDPGGYARVDWPAGNTYLEPALAGAAFSRVVTALVPPPAASTAGVRMPWLPFYIGLGVGGNQQSGPMPADVDTDYPGTNTQSDADPTVTGLERPVRVLLENAGPPTLARWLNPIATYTPQPVITPYTSMRFTSTFSITDINTGCKMNGAGFPLDFATVPVSEAALFRWTDDADMATVFYNPPGDPMPPYATAFALNYFTFPPLPKTNVLNLTVQWDYIVV
jgi:hypothetical protein